MLGAMFLMLIGGIGVGVYAGSYYLGLGITATGVGLVIALYKA